MKLPRTATILHLIATGLSIVCNASGSPAVESSGIQSSNAYIGEARTSSTKAKALPRGFESYNDPNGTGRLIFEKKSSGSTSAIATMRQFLSSLKGSFDGPMKIVAATGDPKDTIVQAMLTIQIGGQPVQAVASVAVNQGSFDCGPHDRPALCDLVFPAVELLFEADWPACRRLAGICRSGPLDLAATERG